jgi:large subunit ribosomal protein L2
MKSYKPYTSTKRTQKTVDMSTLSKIPPERLLTKSNQRAKGRNNQGRITIRHKGGGHKRLYRIIDFKRNKINTEGQVASIEYDPNRNANISLINYTDGEKRYILHPEGLSIGDFITSGIIKLSVGNSMPLEFIPLGTEVHNIEMNPGKGGQFARSAGTFAKIIAKENNYVILKLSSKEVRLFRKECCATIGRISNSTFYNTVIAKAGRNRWLGIRPSVRGSAMNPIDHPHGGGEGRCPIGKSRPLTPWGKPTLGLKTRKKSKRDAFILIKRSK